MVALALTSREQFPNEGACFKQCFALIRHGITSEGESNKVVDASGKGDFAFSGLAGSSTASFRDEGLSPNTLNVLFFFGSIASTLLEVTAVDGWDETTIEDVLCRL